MLLAELRKIIDALPPSCNRFEVINLETVKAEANGFIAINVPINSVAINLTLGQVMLVDATQASVFRIAGNVPIKAA